MDCKTDFALAGCEHDALRRRGGDDCALLPAVYLLRKAKRDRTASEIAHGCLHDDGAVGNLGCDLNGLNHGIFAEGERHVVVNTRSPADLFEIGAARNRSW